MQKIKISSIERNILNPRKNFDTAKLQELADSIKEVGIIEPLVVSAYNPGHGDGELRFRIIAGERRWKAATMAGLDEVPCIVRFDLTAEQEIRLAIIENLQRQDLDPIEEARAYRLLLDMSKEGRTQESLAAELGVSQAHIANRMRLLELPEEIQENISRGIISPSVAKELLAGRKADPKVIEKVAKKAADEGLTVKQVAEAMARETYDKSRQLSDGCWNSPKFDTNDCDGCKKKTMLKCPWNDREKLRCLDAACWDEKYSEYEKQGKDEKEKELLAKFPDAMTVTRSDTFFERLNSTDYCKEKNCNDLRKARYKDTDWVMDICFNPDKYKACQEEAQQKRKRELEEKKEAAKAELKDLVDAKLRVRSDRKTLIYIAATIMEEVTGGWNADMNVYQYIEQVAGEVKLEDPTEDNEETWILEMLKRFSEEQLFRIIIEWPVICNGIEPGSIAEWYFKGTEEPEEEIPPDYDPDPDGHGTCRICGCTDDAACPGGCYWVESDLCSCCADPEPDYDQEPDLKTEERVLLEPSGDQNCDNCGVDKETCPPYQAVVKEGLYTGDCVCDDWTEAKGAAAPKEADPPSELQSTNYIYDGFEIFVSKGLWGGDDDRPQYGTFRHSGKGGLHRVKSPAMPMVATAEEAQRNLDAWAVKKGLRVVKPAEEVEAS